MQGSFLLQPQLSLNNPSPLIPEADLKMFNTLDHSKENIPNCYENVWRCYFTKNDFQKKLIKTLPSSSFQLLKFQILYHELWYVLLIKFCLGWKKLKRKLFIWWFIQISKFCSFLSFPHQIQMLILSRKKLFLSCFGSSNIFSEKVQTILRLNCGDLEIQKIN